MADVPTPLLLGLLCAVAAAIVGAPAATASRRGSGLLRRTWNRVRDAGAGPWWPAAIAAVGLLQLAAAQPRIARYRFTLLGLRYQIAPAPPARGAAVSAIDVGGASDAELRIPGLRDTPIAWLVAEHRDSAIATLRASVVRHAAGVLVVTQAEETRLIGGAPFDERDTLDLPTGDSLVFATALVGAARGRLGAPAHQIRTLRGGQPVTLPGVMRHFRDRVPDGVRRPTWRERIYPLADILPKLGVPASVADTLSGFFYYDDDERLHLANLDSLPWRGAHGVVADTVWTRDGAWSLAVGGLPSRDYAPLAVLPGRPGIRTLLRLQPSARGGWLDLSFSSPEVIALDARELRSLDVARGRSGVDYRLRFSGVPDTRARQAVTFTTPSNRFESGSQAVFGLSQDPAADSLEVRTPAGVARIASGAPFALGDGQHAVVMRVDGQNTSVRFWLAVVLVLALGASAFLIESVAGDAFVLALTGFAFGVLHLLLGFGAGIVYPFSVASLQKGFWIAPFVPWAVIAVAGGGRGQHRAEGGGGLGMHALYALALAAVAYAVYAPAQGLGGKRLFMVGLPFGVLALRAWRDGALGPVATAAGTLWATSRRAVARRVHLPRWASRWASRWGPRWTAGRAWFGGRVWGRFPGGCIAAALFSTRFVLFMLGRHEAVSLFGERFALSIVYTPACLAGLAWTVTRHVERLRAHDAARGPAPVWRFVLDVWLYLTVGFVFTGVLVSDLGIVLVTQTGAMLLLVLLVRAWFPSRRASPPVLACVAFPLLVFTLLQLDPLLALRGADPDRARSETQDWTANDLRLLGQGDPSALELIGQRRSEALGVMKATMGAYAAGPWFGAGFLRGRVSSELRPTSVREHVPSTLVASQWGFLGAVGVLLMLVPFLTVAARLVPFRAPADTMDLMPVTVAAAMLWFLTRLPLSAPWGLLIGVAAVGSALLTLVSTRGRRATAPAAPGAAGAPRWQVLTAALFLVTLGCTGAYMILANYNAVLFTGKNVYLLGLDSLADLLESAALLLGAAWVLREPAETAVVVP